MLEQEKVLFTGGGGLLGAEFKKILPHALYPSVYEFDVTDCKRMKLFLVGKEINNIIHAAAFTSPPRVDKNPMHALDVNIVGTANVVKISYLHKCRLIYLSTDYVFNGDKGNYAENDPVYPVNKYAWSKMGGECAVKLYDNSLIVRTSFGPTEFPFEKAFVDQWTSRESVDIIAKKIFFLLHSKVVGTIHVGGSRKTVFDYAKDLDINKHIGTLSVKDVDFNVPKDTSLDCTQYDKLVEIEKTVPSCDTMFQL